MYIVFILIIKDDVYFFFYILRFKRFHTFTATFRHIKFKKTKRTYMLQVHAKKTYNAK